MKRWLFMILVATVFVFEAAWSASTGGDGPLARLANGDHSEAHALETMRDPLLAWSEDNTALDAILASAVWPGTRECLRPAGCTTSSHEVNRAL